MKTLLTRELPAWVEDVIFYSVGLAAIIYFVAQSYCFKGNIFGF